MKQTWFRAEKLLERDSSRVREENPSVLPGQGDQKQTSQGQFAIGTDREESRSQWVGEEAGGGGSSGDLLRGMALLAGFYLLPLPPG